MIYGMRWPVFVNAAVSRKTSVMVFHMTVYEGVSSNKKRQMENIDTTCINVRVMFILDGKEFPSKRGLLDFHSQYFEGVLIAY